MDTADTTSLARLYRLSVDVDVFPILKQSLQAHIEVGLLDGRSADTSGTITQDHF